MENGRKTARILPNIPGLPGSQLSYQEFSLDWKTEEQAKKKGVSRLGRCPMVRSRSKKEESSLERRKGGCEGRVAILRVKIGSLLATVGWRSSNWYYWSRRGLHLGRCPMLRSKKKKKKKKKGVILFLALFKIVGRADSRAFFSFDSLGEGKD